jgi:hypothetical protein
MTNMGIGRLGAPDIIIKRKFRWTFEISTPAGTVPRHYVKVAARPQLDIDELEINYLNGVTWIPGKGKWQPLSVTYIDVAGADMSPLYSWLARVYDFSQQNPTDHLPQSEKAGWNGTATLTMLDGCGTEIDRFILRSCWPQSINFGDLDYSDSAEATIELSLRYSEVSYQSVTCGATVAGGCVGCG